MPTRTSTIAPALQPAPSSSRARAPDMPKADADSRAKPRPLARRPPAAARSGVGVSRTRSVTSHANGGYSDVPPSPHLTSQEPATVRLTDDTSRMLQAAVALANSALGTGTLTTVEDLALWYAEHLRSPTGPS